MATTSPETRLCAWACKRLYSGCTLDEGDRALLVDGPGGQWGTAARWAEKGKTAFRSWAGAQGLDYWALAEGENILLKPTSTAEALANLVPTVPELPPRARPEPGLSAGAGGWIDAYCAYADAVSPMTPLDFHLSAALFLAGVAVARRLKLPIETLHYADVYPNLAIAWIAVTTLYRKSTSLNVAHDLARRAFPWLLMPQKVTPEAFLSDLAGREPAQIDFRDRPTWEKRRDYSAQQGWILDEASGLLAAAGREYNAGLVEDILLFYDDQQRYTRSTRGQGLVVVEDAYLSLLWASTPAAMAAHLSAERLWAMGFWARFVVLTPDLGRPPWREASASFQGPENLAQTLRALFDRLPPSTYGAPPEALAVTLAPDVFGLWKAYNRACSYDFLDSDAYPEIDARLYGPYGRLPTKAWKVATLLAALDWPPRLDAPQIERCHIARAIEICESWRASYHRVLASVAVGAFDRLRVRILRQVGRREPEGATLRDLRNAMRDIGPRDLSEAVNYMIELGDLASEDAGTGRPGRPTVRYKLNGHH